MLKADKYDKIADELTNTLLHKWDAATKESISDMIRTLRKLHGKAKPADLDEQLNTLAMRLGPRFANQISAPLFEAHVDAFTAAQKEIKASFAAKFNLVDEKAIAALHEHNVYWAREQYDANFRDKTVEFGERVIREGLNFRQAGELFEAEFAEQYNRHGTNYWRGFATNLVTRSREIGRVNAYEKAGVEYLEIRAVLDHRTSKICREMHGRQIAVQKAIDMRDDLIAAKTPEDVKKIAPWRKEDFVRGKKTTALPSGMSLPPYHFRCRTRTVVMDTTVDVEAEKGATIAPADKKLLNSLTAREHYARAQGLNAKRWNRKDWKDDSVSHIGQFGLGEKDFDGYKAAAVETLKTADRIAVKIYKDDFQYLFFSDKTGGILTIDMAGQVRGLYGHGSPKNLKKAIDNYYKGDALWLKANDKN